METDSDNTKRWGPYRGEGVRTVKRCTQENLQQGQPGTPPRPTRRVNAFFALLAYYHRCAEQE